MFRGPLSMLNPAHARMYEARDKRNREDSYKRGREIVDDEKTKMFRISGKNGNLDITEEEAREIAKFFTQLFS